MGASEVTYACNSGESRTYAMLGLNVQALSITERVIGRNNFGCSVAAGIAGRRESLTACNAAAASMRSNAKLSEPMSVRAALRC